MKRFRLLFIILLTPEILVFPPLQAASDTLSAIAVDQAGANFEKRILDAPGVTLQAPFGKLALGSFHLEMKARQPRFDNAKKLVVIDVWTLRADLERDNVSVVCNIKEPTTGKAQTIEG
jgi:hypothetical protein